MINTIWNTGSNNTRSLVEIIEISKDYIERGAKVFIGSDSFQSNKRITFATAICLQGNSNPGRYFFVRENIDIRFFNSLSARITEETRRSIEIAEYFLEVGKIPSSSIELHLDVSPFHANNGTSKFSEMLKGYVAGYGLECKIKPNAWASQTVADRHSK